MCGTWLSSSTSSGTVAARAPPGYLEQCRQLTQARAPLRRVMKSAQQGADTLIWLATEPAER
jgi:hypothetical protein